MEKLSNFSWERFRVINAINNVQNSLPWGFSQEILNWYQTAHILSTTYCINDESEMQWGFLIISYKLKTPLVLSLLQRSKIQKIKYGHPNLYTTFKLLSAAIGRTSVLVFELIHTIQNELYLTIIVCSHQDLTKISCKMLVVICVVLFFLEQQTGAVGGRCSSAEDATKRKFL